MRLADEIKRKRQKILDEKLSLSTGVLHLGAHLGQEAQTYANWNLPVIWVEAIPSVCTELAKRVSKFSNQKAFCALLDSINGLQRTFNISNNTGGVSSSIFAFDEYANGEKSLWPELNLEMVDHVILPSTKLDTLLDANAVEKANYDFWVIDLQGAELLALAGAEESIQHSKSLYVEVSTVAVYDGGAQWLDLKNHLNQKGFYPCWLPELEHDDVLFVRV